MGGDDTGRTKETNFDDINKAGLSSELACFRFTDRDMTNPNTGVSDSGAASSDEEIPLIDDDDYKLQVEDETEATAHSPPSRHCLRRALAIVGRFLQRPIVRYSLAFITAAGSSGWAADEAFSGDIKDTIDEYKQACAGDNSDEARCAVATIYAVVSLILNDLINNHYVYEAGRDLERDTSGEAEFWTAFFIALFASGVAALQASWTLLDSIYVFAPMLIVSLFGTIFTRFPGSLGLLRLSRRYCKGDELTQRRLAYLMEQVEFCGSEKISFLMQGKSREDVMTDYAKIYMKKFERIVMERGGSHEERIQWDPKEKVYAVSKAGTLLYKIHPVKRYPLAAFVFSSASAVVGAGIYLPYVQFISVAFETFGLDPKANMFCYFISIILGCILGSPHTAFYIRTFYDAPDRLYTFLRHDMDKFWQSVPKRFWGVLSAATLFVVTWISAASVEKFVTGMIKSSSGLQVLSFIHDKVFSHPIYFMPKSVMGVVGLVVYGLVVNGINATRFFNVWAEKKRGDTLDYKRVVRFLHNHTTIHLDEKIEDEVLLRGRVKDKQCGVKAGLRAVEELVRACNPRNRDFWRRGQEEEGALFFAPDGSLPPNESKRC